MSELLKKLEHETQRLSKQERAFLADRLLSSLDGEEHNDVEAAWIAEAERRYKEYKEGRRSVMVNKKRTYNLGRLQHFFFFIIHWAYISQIGM